MKLFLKTSNIEVIKNKAHCIRGGGTKPCGCGCIIHAAHKMRHEKIKKTCKIDG